MFFYRKMLNFKIFDKKQQILLENQMINYHNLEKILIPINEQRKKEQKPALTLQEPTKFEEVIELENQIEEAFQNILLGFDSLAKSLRSLTS